MTLDYDPSYELYCHELEIEHYMQSQEFIDKINQDLQDLRIYQLEELI